MGNGAIVSTVVVPDAPRNLIRDAVATTTSQVGLSWDQGLLDGGSPVIDYRVAFDIGDGTFIVVQSGLTVRSYRRSPLNQGQSYTFKVQARNAVGFSLYSEPISIIAAVGPS